MNNRMENLDNDDIRKLREKQRKRMEKQRLREEKEEKKRPRLERNLIAVVGLILAGNAFILSFTGWFVWLDLIALLLCVIGLLPNRPRNIKKYLALLGLALSAVAIINAVRVSSKWIVDPDSLQQPGYTTELSE